MCQPTLFNGTRVVLDAMIIINFHNLLALEDLVNWAKGELVVEPHVLKEAKFSKAGKIELRSFIENQYMIEEQVQGEE